jgi:hypothetical protein
MSGATGISTAVATATVPPQVQKEGADAVQAFRAALSFESMLLKQMLTEALPETPTGAGAEEEDGFGGGEGGALAATPTPVSLPETVAEAVVDGGGLGLARQMYTSFEGVGR